jgi:hypothetical protein
MGSRDTAALYGPLRPLVTDALRAGRLPLWNAWEGMGKPLLADGIHGVLHPFSLVAALLDPGGIDLLVALYLVAAALGAYALARVLGLAPPHAFLAGAAFGLSGFVVSMAANLVFLAGAASMPWQVAALAALGREERSRLSVPLAALATAATLLSGDAQVAAVSALLGGALAAERAGWRGTGRAALATLLGALLAAVQLLPTLAAIPESARASGLGEIEARQWALSPWRLPELLLPGLFLRLGEIDSPLVIRWLGGPGDAAYDLPFSLSVFVGAPVLALATCAPLGRRTIRLLAVAAGILLWLALGHFAGARQALGWVPVWGIFRYAEKLVAPLSLLLALLAAHGAEGPEGTGPRPRRLAMALLGLSAVGVAAFAISKGVEGPPPGRAADALRSNVAAGLPHALFASAALGATLLLRREGPWRPLALAGAVLASLFAALPASRVLLPREPCRTWPGLLAAEPPGPRLIVPYLSTTIPHASFAERGATALDVMAADDCGRARLGMPSYPVRDRIGTFWSYGGLGSRRLTLLVKSLPDGGARTGRHFSVTHAAFGPPTAPDEEGIRTLASARGRLVATDPEFPIELWEVPHAPWARFAPEVEVVPGPEAAAARFVAGLAANRDATVVESDAPVPAGRGEVRLRLRAPERVELEVEAAEEGLVVVNDAWWPGWRARVDGRDAPLLPTNVVSRGVVVPAGRHAVAMDYAPPGLAAGIVLSLLGLAATAALALRRGRVSAPPTSSPGPAAPDPSAAPGR